MKRTLLALILICSIALSGCSSLFNRDYAVVTTHPNYPSTEEDSSVIGVETYQELVSAVLYFVSQGTESGVVRLVNYAQDVDTHLAQACLEVAKDDPLGAYAVDYIKYDYTRVGTTYEANIEISYRRTLEQMQSLVNVTGSSAIRQELQTALNSFATEITLSVGYFAEDEAYIRSLVRQAYYDTPSAALGMPNYYVNIYPDAGYQRIIEITLVYPQAESTLQSRQNMVLTTATSFASPYQSYTDTHARLVNLLSSFAQNVTYSAGSAPPYPATVWDALVGRVANDEGIALALSLLCDELDIPHTLVEGTLNGAPHYWITVPHTDGTTHYIDLSREDDTPTLYTAQEFADMGYVWAEDYPGVTPPVEEPLLPEPQPLLPDEIPTPQPLPEPDEPLPLEGEEM